MREQPQPQSLKFEWTEACTKAFNTMKKMIAEQILLAYPDFNQPFHVNRNASKLQFGAVISPNGKTIVFYSCEINPAQTRYYTTTEESPNYFP